MSGLSPFSRRGLLFGLRINMNGIERPSIVFLTLETPHNINPPPPWHPATTERAVGGNDTEVQCLLATRFPGGRERRIDLQMVGLSRGLTARAREAESSLRYRFYAQQCEQSHAMRMEVCKDFSFFESRFDEPTGVL
jgi:hypothetical protein